MSFAPDIVTNWIARLQGRLYAQFAQDPSWNQWCVVIGRQAQDLEDVIQSLITLPSIANGFGAQLDTIGRIVGQSRAGFGDTTYKAYLFARVSANRSSGSPESLFKVFNALFGSTVGQIYTPGGLKAFELQMVSPVSDAIAQAGPGFLNDAKDAGARAIFEWQELPDSGMFCFGVECALTATANINDSTITVDSTANFPPTGSLVLDPLGTSETHNFEVVNLHVLQLTTLVSAAHLAGTPVELATDGGSGFAAGASVTTQNIIGATTLAVDETSNLPASGTVVIDGGMVNEEQATYTITDGTHLSVSALAFVHAIGASVGALNIGGAFAGAIEA